MTELGQDRYEAVIDPGATGDISACAAFYVNPKTFELRGLFWTIPFGAEHETLKDVVTIRIRRLDEHRDISGRVSNHDIDVDIDEIKNAFRELGALR